VELQMTEAQIEAFLAEPITAQLATNGPTIRPIWFHWENGAFWVISGPWAKLFTRVQTDPKIALCVDVGDFDGGIVKQVCAYGSVTVEPYDVELARRMLHRYLGADESTWSDAPDDYRGYVRDGGPPGGALLRMVPRKLTGLDFTYARVREAA
jgi:hypothetical protein